MNPSSLFQIPRFATRVLPVIVITHVHQAVPLAHALLEGGIDAMEITLRHAAGLPAIEAVAREVPEMVVGAGTVTHASELTQVGWACSKPFKGLWAICVFALPVASLPINCPNTFHNPMSPWWVAPG